MSAVPVYCYIRFSTPKQEQGDSRERQENACLAYCARKGWTNPILFGDYGRSAWVGTHLTKGELGKFADRVRSGEIPRNSILCVEDLDRLSRQEARTTQRWLEDMADLGLRFAVVSNDKIYDQASLKASIFETFEILMKAQAAWEYSQRLSKRLLSSWDNRRKDTEASGRIISAHVPGWLRATGDSKDQNRKFEIIKGRDEIVREIYRLAADGVGAKAIAKTLNARGIEPWGKDHHHRESNKVGWEHSYVAHVLSTAAVEGDYEPGKGRKSYKNKTGQRFVGYYQHRVVDADLVARARAAVASRKGTGGRKRDQCNNLFSGLVICEHCGGRMNMVGNSKAHNRYLQCSDAHHNRGGEDACKQRKSFRYPEFEKGALDAILHLALDDRFFIRPDESNTLAIKLAEANKAVDEKKKAALNLGQAIAAKPDSETLHELLEQTEADLKALRAQAAELDRALQHARGAVTPQEHLQRVLEVRGALEHPDYETRLTARRKVSEAIRNVVSQVRMEVVPTRDEKRPAKFVTIILANGAHAVRLDGMGGFIAEVSLAVSPADDPGLRHGLTGGDAKREAELAGYLRRRAANE